MVRTFLYSLGTQLLKVANVMNYYYFHYRGISYCFICFFRRAIGKKFLLGGRIQFLGVELGCSGKPFLPNFSYIFKDLLIFLIFFFGGEGGGGREGGGNWRRYSMSVLINKCQVLLLQIWHG